ncbi:hypothetical protein [Streptomyces erythrochromogenes]|uniref:hypothetical protein n=1 Tax=Streptomyces erythrochromogenes TaxID=285574 RepID=UPI0022571D71|nr:hypothetical protein [Streptomyces erythrochromogenes]MCX5589549.1 hypothetical protein [Streptomyces erythrochromogenes]
MSKHRQWPGPKGQSYVAAPELPSYDRPPASDVTIVRRDGTQETRPALAPRLSRGSYDRARPNAQETGKLAKKCASCDGEFKEGQRKERRYDAWRHRIGECAPQTTRPVQPVQHRPTGRKVPLHEKVARRFWIRRPCPLCDAKAGQDCTDPGEPGEPGGTAVRREHGHDERIEPIVKEREAATKARKAREPEDRLTQRGKASLVPSYRLLKISCPVCHAKPNAECALPAGSHQARLNILNRHLGRIGGRRRR